MTWYKYMVMKLGLWVQKVFYSQTPMKKEPCEFCGNAGVGAWGGFLILRIILKRSFIEITQHTIHLPF
jgi:hypothetical protein